MSGRHGSGECGYQPHEHLMMMGPPRWETYWDAERLRMRMSQRVRLICPGERTGMGLSPLRLMLAAAQIYERAPDDAELVPNKVGHLSLRHHGQELAILDVHDGSVEWLSVEGRLDGSAGSPAPPRG